MEKKFKSFIPMDIVKSDDGEWKIRGLASTASRDRQGEVILQDGLDLTPIYQKRGVFNWDHNKDVSNTVGLIDKAERTDQGLVVEGRLFKNHDKAKSIYQIMTSLGKSDRGRLGMSVEGAIKERSGPDGKIIKKAVINAVALTMNPVNTDTFVDLAKSMGAESIEFSEEYSLGVCEDLQKALSVGGAAATSTPAQLSGGDALSMEEFGDRKKKKKLKKMDSEMAKSSILTALEVLQTMYPDHSKTELWEVFKDRLNQKFPDLELN
jgi:hypothetical protein